jgi:hypothetical protein
MGEQLEKFQHIGVPARHDRRVITQVIASDLALTSCSFITDKRTNGPSHKTSRLFDCCYIYQSPLTSEKREVFSDTREERSLPVRLRLCVHQLPTFSV